MQYIESTSKEKVQAMVSDRGIYSDIVYTVTSSLSAYKQELCACIQVHRQGRGAEATSWGPPDVF